MEHIRPGTNRLTGRELWLAVIKQTLDDFQNPPTNHALSWAIVDPKYFSTPDFREVCNLAGVDAAQVRKVRYGV